MDIVWADVRMSRCAVVDGVGGDASGGGVGADVGDGVDAALAPLSLASSMLAVYVGSIRHSVIWSGTSCTEHPRKVPD